MRNERQDSEAPNTDQPTSPPHSPTEAFQMILEESSVPSEISAKLASLFSEAHTHLPTRPHLPLNTIPSVEPKWRPLPERLPKNQSNLKELLRYLHPEQRRYIQNIHDLLAQEHPTANEHALMLLHKIPFVERCKLRGLLLLELNLLSALGQHKLYAQTLLLALQSENDPLHWFEIGAVLVQLSRSVEQDGILSQEEFFFYHQTLQEMLATQSSPLLRIFFLHRASYSSEYHQALPKEYPIERIMVEAWKADLFFPQSPFYEYVLGLLVYATHRFVLTVEVPDPWMGKIQATRFLWTRLSASSLESLHGLFSLLEKQHDSESILEICRELLTLYPKNPHLHYWRGHLLKDKPSIKEKAVKETANSFRIVIHHAAEMPRNFLYEAAFWWASREEIPADIWKTLQDIEAMIAEDINLQAFFLRIGMLFARRLQENEQTDLLQQMEALLAIFGDLPNVSRYIYEHLVVLGQFAEVEPILLRWWEENKTEHSFAGGLLAVGWTHRGETARTCTLFGSETEAAAYLESLSLVASTLPKLFRVAWGVSQLRSGDASVGMAWLEKAHEEEDDAEVTVAFLEALFHRLHFLTEQGENDDFKQEIEYITERFIQISTPLRSTGQETRQVSMLLSLFFVLTERWEEARTLLEKIGITFFEDPPSAHSTGHLLFMLTYAGCGEWELAARSALQLFPSVVKTSEHHDVFYQFLKHFVDVYVEQQKHVYKLEKKLQKQTQQGQTMSALQEEKARLKQTLRKISTEKGTLQKALFDAHQATQRPEETKKDSENLFEKKVEDFKKHHRSLLREYPYNHREMLLQAERLWWQSALSPRDDHAPVALQFSRVVEWALNHYWVDPLMAFALERGIRLTDLPACRSRLLASRNRLTVGDALRLFYVETVREKDGQEERLQNAHANETLRALLAAYHSERAATLHSEAEKAHRYLQYEAAFVLTELLRLRNRASHAGAMLSRTEVGDLRRWVMGDEKTLGLLEALFQFAPTETD